MCRPDQCRTCEYSKLTVLLFTDSPRKECYVQFIKRCLFWRVVGDLVARCRERAAALRKGKAGRSVTYKKEEANAATVILPSENMS